MDLINLEENYPSVHCGFIKGGFTVQMSSRKPFGKMEDDKVIKKTINRDTKTPSGTRHIYFYYNLICNWMCKI